ncbi:hypothetical protein SAMN04487860_1098 [Ruminococcus flavefaciens]|uniref:AAA-like domain-containing protein n=2 Tax=Ruminococcus flavefaciens TaxID=1265 RepID=A0A1M7KIL6_RUMFL|nr:hypothetical protein SAMN04487860_1098 [Ruminococcus flavefaciens]
MVKISTFDDELWKAYSYGNPTYFDVMEKFNRYVKAEIEKGVLEKVDDAKKKALCEQEEELKLKLQREAEEDNKKKVKPNLRCIKPLIHDTVSFVDQTYDGRDYVIPNVGKYSRSYDKELRKNPYGGDWELTYNTKGPRFISSVNVATCLIVNASGPGICDALVIFLRGRDKPIVFAGGNLSDTRIINALQLEDTAPEKRNWVAAAFRASLRDCDDISFLDIPQHAGGNMLRDGKFVYVSSFNVYPGTEALFPNEVKNHFLIHGEPDLTLAVNNYKPFLPQCWKAKYMIVERVKSILLPWFKNYGLNDDRISVVIYRHEEDKLGCIALAKRSNYESTIVKSLMDKNVDVKKELAATNDVTAVFTFSLTVESRRTCSQQFTDILLDLKGENGIENPTRKNIILLTETPARIPSDFPAVYLTMDENITWGDYKELQRTSGAFDYSLISFFYTNQYATNSLVGDTLKHLRLYGKEKNIDYPSKSAEMSLATAWMLKRLGIVTDAEYNDMLLWLTSNAPTISSASEALCNEIGAIGSESICSGEITPSRGDGQYPPWNESKIFVAADGTYNWTRELLEQKVTSKMKGTDSFNKSCQALEAKGLSCPTRTGEHTRTLTVKCEGGGAIKREFISLSPELFSVEARQVVEKTLIADTFVEYKNCPKQFNPLIKHTKFDLLAGQLIGSYSAINPFVLVTGSPGLGKSDFLMMQAILRADSGDTVFIYDQTNAFCRFEWAAHMVPQEIIDNIIFWDLSTMGLPIDLLDFSGCEGHVQKVQRLSSLLKSGAHLTGPNQFSVLQKVVESIISSYEDGNNDIKRAIELSLKKTGKEGEVRQRLVTMFSSVARNIRTPYDWEELVAMRRKIIVFSAGNAVVKPDANPLDMVLDSYFAFKDKHRDKNVTLILDEVQRMNIAEEAPIDVILSTGRKLNISVYIATQRYVLGKGNLPRIEEYCGTKIFFQPMDSCVKNAATTTHLSVDELLSFEQGKCAVVGSIYSEHMGKNIPVRNAIVGMTYRPPCVDSYD